MTASPLSSPGCPDATLMAAFYEGAVSEGERRQVLAHMGDCAACRRLLSGLDRMATGPNPEISDALMARAEASGQIPWHRRRAWQVAAAAACLLVAVSVLRPPSPDGKDGVAGSNSTASVTTPVTTPADGLRNRDLQQKPQLLVPVDGQSIGPAPVMFRWTATPDALQYRVQVLEGDGTVAWSAVTSQTSAEFRQSLSGGGPYYAWVSAQMPDGRRVQSDVVRLIGAAR